MTGVGYEKNSTDYRGKCRVWRGLRPKIWGAANQVDSCCPRFEKLEAVQQELGDTECHLLQLDVRDRNGVAETLSSLPESFREVDVLINNAGLALGLEPAHEADLDKW